MVGRGSSNQDESDPRSGDVHSGSTDQRHSHEQQRRPHDSSIGHVLAGGQDGIQQAIHEVARERQPRRVVLRYGRAWLVGYALVVAVVVALAFAARAISVLPGDLPFARELQENRSPIVFVSMYAVSFIGYPLQALIILVAAALGLWAVRLRLEAIFLLVTQLADLISQIVKVAVERSRPSSSLVDVVAHLDSYSFPSGHTVHYTVFYGFLAFVIATNFRPHWVRQVCLAICIGLIVLVGPSRVYLGEHWPTDVLAGYLIGGLFLVPLIAAYLWAKERAVVLARWPFLRWRHGPH
jgi:membrane-associated phospholipid phosphatase